MPIPNWLTNVGLTVLNPLTGAAKMIGDHVSEKRAAERQEVIDSIIQPESVSPGDVPASSVSPNSSASSNIPPTENPAFDFVDWVGSLFNSEGQFAAGNREYNSLEAEKNRQFQAEQAEIARRFNSNEAQLNRDWQEMMSNTSYQRAVKDLQAAGLNPVLAYSHFSGASSPAGSSASASAPSGSAASSTTNGGVNAYDMLSLLVTLYGDTVDGITSLISSMTKGSSKK